MNEKLNINEDTKNLNESEIKNIAVSLLKDKKWQIPFSIEGKVTSLMKQMTIQDKHLSLISEKITEALKDKKEDAYFSIKEMEIVKEYISQLDKEEIEKINKITNIDKSYLENPVIDGHSSYSPKYLNLVFELKKDIKDENL